MKKVLTDIVVNESTYHTACEVAKETGKKPREVLGEVFEALLTQATLELIMEGVIE